jgi:flagellar motor switch protein FliG
MDNRRTIVVTAYGHSKTIDKIAVSLFEISGHFYRDSQSYDAEIYCNTINTLELEGDSWIFAKTLSENTQYEMEVLLPLKFSDVIMKLDNLTVQEVSREFDFKEIAISLKDQDEEVKDKIFANMSKRASKTLKEEISYIGPVNMMDVKESQKKFIDIVRLSSGEWLLFHV